MPMLYIVDVWLFQKNIRTEMSKIKAAWRPGVLSSLCDNSLCLLAVYESRTVVMRVSLAIYIKAYFFSLEGKTYSCMHIHIQMKSESDVFHAFHAALV